MSNLLPCPFCSSAADCRVDKIVSGSHVPSYYVGCSKCRFYSEDNNYEVAISRWNIRVLEADRERKSWFSYIERALYDERAAIVAWMHDPPEDMIDPIAEVISIAETSKKIADKKARHILETVADHIDRSDHRRTTAFQDMGVYNRIVHHERARCAAIARAWVVGSPTSTTESVVKAIAEAIDAGETANALTVMVPQTN